MKYEEGRITVSQLFPIAFEEWDCRQPELKLWAVCLSQGIAGAVGIVRCNDLRAWRKEDRFWLFRDRRRAVGSCAWICEYLEIDRRELITFVWKNRHVLRRSPYRLRSIN